MSYVPGVRKAIDEYVVSKNYNLKILNSRFAEITKNFITYNWYLSYWYSKKFSLKEDTL